MQDAAVDTVRDTLKSWGDADRQAERLSKLVELGWYFVDADGKHITGLVNTEGKQVTMADGSPATPEKLPMSFLSAAAGMRYDHHVPQVTRHDFVDNGKPADVDGITEAEALACIQRIMADEGVRRTIESLNNGLRLHPTHKEKEIGKKKPKSVDVSAISSEFLAAVTKDLTNPANLALLTEFGKPTTNKADFLAKWKAGQSQ
jgi:hypothetical protein